MTPGMQAGDAGGFFKDATALLGLGLDDLADAALMHERRRARTGRGVGKQDLDVARAHLAPVDAIIGTGVAFDTAGNLERILVVEGRGRRAGRIVDCDRHLGIVAGADGCSSRKRSRRPWTRRAWTCTRIRP